MGEPNEQAVELQQQQQQQQQQQTMPAPQLALTPEQVTEQQLSRVQRDQYTIRKRDAALYYEQASMVADERTNYLQRPVRKVILENLGRKRYAAFDELKIKQAGQEDEEKIELHHAAGSKLALNGEDVLEFNIAGSGFRYPRMEHKDFVGWYGQDEYREKDLKVHWYNKTRLLTWLPKIRTKKRIEEINATRLQKNRQVEEIYGQKVEEKIKGKTLNHLRKKEAVNDKGATKTKFSLRGPNGMNIGKYSEDHLEEYILELGKATLTNKFARLKELSPVELKMAKKLNIIIQGHSRGGVAAGLGAMRLKRWIADEFPEFLDKVHFELIQYDPVAGGYENYGNNEKIDHDPADPELVKKDKRYMSLGDEANTTVLYSMHTQHSVAFTPQLVKNPKRIILSMADHGVNMFQADKSQQGPDSRVTYLAEKDGKVQAFRSTGLGEMDAGVYMTDDQNNLIRLRSLEEFDAIAKPLLKGTIMQSSRHEVVRKAVKAWFEANGSRMEEKQAPESGKELAFRKELERLAIPKELDGALQEKEKLDQMPRETKEQQAEYLKKKEKYLTAKRSGLKAYVKELEKEKGGFVTPSVREYLFLLADLSYRIEREQAVKEQAPEGAPEEGYREKTAELLDKIQAHPCHAEADRVIPIVLQRELYAGSAQQIGELIKEYKAESKQAEKPVEEKQEEKPAEAGAAEFEDPRLAVYNEQEKLRREQAIREAGHGAVPLDLERLVQFRSSFYRKVWGERNGKTIVVDYAPKEGVSPQLIEDLDWLVAYYRLKAELKENTKAELKEIPFTEHQASMREKGMDKAYEKQPRGSNNCFCCAGTAMLKQFLARKLNKDIAGGPDQFEMRAYRPRIRKYDPSIAPDLSREEYDRLVLELDQYAGKDKRATGSIFDMGDFLLEKLSEQGIGNVMLNRSVLEVPTADMPDEREERKFANMKAYFSDKLNEIISAGSIAGVLVNEDNGFAHYVTVTGINGEKLTVYDSMDRSKSGKPKEMPISSFLKRGSRIEVNWLSDAKAPEELTKEFGDLKYDGQTKAYSLKDPTFKKLSQTGALYHTKGISVMKSPEEMGEGLEGITEMAYIQTSGVQAESVKMDEAAKEARTNQKVYRQKQKEEEAAAELERKQAEQKFREEQKAKEEQKAREALKAKEEQKAREALKAAEEQAQKGEDLKEQQKQVTGLFAELMKKIHDPYYDKNFGMEVKDEIWSRVERRTGDDSASFKHFRAAVMEVKKLAAGLKAEKMEQNPAETDRIMAAMARLSETANVFYDEHRGHQYSERGKEHRKACDLVREITKEFYDRLDIAMGGEGYGNLTLKQVQGKIGSKEKKASEAKMKELVKVCGKWKKHFAKQEGMERSKIRDRARLFEPYRNAIEVYKASHGMKEWPEEIEEVIREANYIRVRNAAIERYERVRDGFSDPITRLAQKHADEMAGRTKAEKELSAKEVDEGLTKEQIKAVDAIDQWFIRNYNNAGIAGRLIGSRNHHGEIVSGLLRKTRRERLYIYYLIETRQRKNPELFDVYASQTYTPNLDKFKDRMLASGFKFMSRITGTYVYMGKVTEALQINREHQELIKDCARLTMDSREVTGKELQELKQKKDEYRSYMLTRTFKSAQAFRGEARLLENKGRGKTKTDEARVKAAQQAFLKDLKELIRADSEIGEEGAYGEALGSVRKDPAGELRAEESGRFYSPQSMNRQELSDYTDTYTKGTAALSSNADAVADLAIRGANLALKGAGMVRGEPYKPVTWHLKDSSLMDTKLYAGSVSSTTILALGGVLSACYGIRNLTQNWENLHGFDKAAGVAEILKTAAVTGKTVLDGIQTGKQYAEFASKGTEAEAVSSGLVKGFGIAVAGLQTAINLYTAVSGKYDSKNSDRAKEILGQRMYEKNMEVLRLQAESREEKKKREAVESPAEREKREKDLRMARYERNMLKLSQSQSGRKKKYAGIQTFASSVTVAGLTVPVAGFAVSLAGTAISTITGLADSACLAGIRLNMFDTYFDFEGFYSSALEEMRNQGQQVYDTDEFKQRMRRVLAASAGFADVNSACEQISKRYADMICNGLYGPVEERASGETRSAYIQLIKSFGLPYDEKKRIPSPALLARKMNGR